MRQFLFLLIITFTNIVYSQIIPQGGKYLDPFRPVWCEGDDLTYANPKPTILYKEVEGTRIEIPNMPAVKTQDEFGGCRAFSLAVLLQKHTCDKWSKYMEGRPCNNPPDKYNLSYFGLMAFTHRSLNENKTFQPNQKKSRSMYDTATDVSKDPRFILESCKPYYKLVEAFSTSGQAGIDKKDQFLAYLKKMYETKKANTEEEVKDCQQCLTDIFNFTGIEPQYFNLKKALSQENYDKFMYSLFFDGCKFSAFAGGFSVKAYPDDSLTVTPEDLKNKIIEGLKKGKPVLHAQICVFTDVNNECIGGHSVVVCGYRKVCDKKGNCKELFKVHNSWGEDWQKKNNNGWIDADILVNSNGRLPNQNSSSKITSASVIWLE